MGHNVKVVHSINYFPSIFYHAPEFLRKFLMNKIGFTLPDKRRTEPERYELDGVDVIRLPMYKRFPMGAYSAAELEKQVERISRILGDSDFRPDVITSHWANPQLYLAAHLKKKYSCRAALVIHDGIRNIRLLPDHIRLIKEIDYWGYRSFANRDEFDCSFDMHPDWFRCLSGVPSQFFESIPVRNGMSSNRLIFVGQLLKRKFPDAVISAAEKTFRRDFTLKIIGNGPMEEDLRRIIATKNLTEQVELTGRLQRDKIISMLDASDVFVMISRTEVFGLVYIEAMARGCIVVASKGEGMEGIIHDGVNGFLCEAGNEEELSSVLTRISSLSPEERIAIIGRGYETALSMTDVKVARHYLNHILPNA